MKTPLAALDFDEQSRDAWGFYQECAAVGEFPDDDAVRTCARVFLMLEKESQQSREDRRFLRLSQAMMTAMGATGVKLGRVPQRGR